MFLLPPFRQRIPGKKGDAPRRLCTQKASLALIALCLRRSRFEPSGEERSDQLGGDLDNCVFACIVSCFVVYVLGLLVSLRCVVLFCLLLGWMFVRLC